MDDQIMCVLCGACAAGIPAALIIAVLVAALRHQLAATEREALAATREGCRANKSEAYLAELRAKHFGRDASLWPAEHRPTLSESL